MVVSCPITVTGGTNVCRNLRVDNRLTIINGATVVAQGDVANYGLITSQPGPASSLTCHNLSNFRLQHAVSETGIINVGGDVTVSGDVINYGMMSAGNLILPVSNQPMTHYLSGSGSWANGGFLVSQNQIASLLTDVTLDSYTTIARKENLTSQRVGDMIKLYRIKILPRIKQLKEQTND